MSSRSFRPRKRSSRRSGYGQHAGPTSPSRTSSFVVDGEAVILGIDGVSDFDALPSGKYNDEVQFYALLVKLRVKALVYARSLGDELSSSKPTNG
jgi:hypothetical protein